MTATAQCAHEEFREFYGLHIVAIPPNNACILNNLGCNIFPTKTDKISVILREIKDIHQINRPILVGTNSVKDSSILAELILKQGLTCNVLNAKNDEHEAKIISLAGKLGAITISTNMAGRGTDIKLGEGNENERKQVVALGGLFVLGTAQYESRRIDDQLRGRAARQGDPGSCRFFISLEDDLFIKYRLRDLLPLKTWSNNVPSRISDNLVDRQISNDDFSEIKSPLVSREISRVQRIIEGQNFEIKKTLWNYTYLIEQQRQIFFEHRNNFLNDSFVLDYFAEKTPYNFALIRKTVPLKSLIYFCKNISLSCIDTHWSSYLAEISDLRDGIHLRKIGGQNPLLEFQRIVIAMFDTLQKNIEPKFVS